jgi:nucleoside diphosphate kinase
MSDTDSLPSGHAAFGLVKPSGVERTDLIEEVLRSHGLAVAGRKILRLGEIDAAVVYPEVRRQLKEHPDLWRAHLRYLASTPCVGLVIVSSRPDGADPHPRLQQAKGSDARSENCAAGTIRALVPGRGVFNSFHSADTAGESMTLFRHFGMPA